MMNKFTICALFYGDYPELAERCLRSIHNAVKPEDLNMRIGLNAVSADTKSVINRYLSSRVQVYESEKNLHKYPMMREMLYSGDRVNTEYTMWFDDDSFVSNNSLTTGGGDTYWLQDVEHAMVNSDMIGSIYTIRWVGNQKEFIRAQPWYGGKDPAVRRSARFATGGWWNIRTSVLYDYNYPWPELDHRGGDVMLGELCFQNNLRLRHFRNGVKINADEHGRESKAKRRGFDQQPVGVEFNPDDAGSALNRATQMVTPVLKKIRKIIEL